MSAKTVAALPSASAVLAFCRASRFALIEALFRAPQIDEAMDHCA